MSAKCKLEVGIKDYDINGHIETHWHTIKNVAEYEILKKFLKIVVSNENDVIIRTEYINLKHVRDICVTVQ